MLLLSCYLKEPISVCYVLSKNLAVTLTMTVKPVSSHCFNIMYYHYTHIPLFYVVSQDLTALIHQRNVLS